METNVAKLGATVKAGVGQGWPGSGMRPRVRYWARKRAMWRAAWARWLSWFFSAAGNSAIVRVWPAGTK